MICPHPPPTNRVRGPPQFCVLRCKYRLRPRTRQPRYAGKRGCGCEKRWMKRLKCQPSIVRLGIRSISRNVFRPRRMCIARLRSVHFLNRNSVNCFNCATIIFTATIYVPAAIRYGYGSHYYTPQSHSSRPLWSAYSVVFGPGLVFGRVSKRRRIIIFSDRWKT